MLTAILKIPLTTQWLRISPRFSERLIGFRFEVYGCLSEKHFSPFEGKTQFNVQGKNHVPAFGNFVVVAVTVADR